MNTTLISINFLCRHVVVLVSQSPYLGLDVFAALDRNLDRPDIPDLDLRLQLLADRISRISLVAAGFLAEKRLVPVEGFVRSGVISAGSGSHEGAGDPG